ncbi:hypothetical protein FA95DRAFT_1554601 [Auriscalpium vulgare]|uniref:Uncharacterized protein n=1 Tax=Auriscalpium vulgare TaxID=40419 RepID=A0ACB8S4Y0_9AGAM|nr:hypothetical protein FA95DRAFT_1554601 [Auriscalpium vulgare]
MQADQSNASQAYTILRIKRKRNEEPLDALVIESRVRRKKSRGGLDVFQFAETVGPEAWKDQQQTRHLQERISALAREQATKALLQQPTAPSQSPSRSPVKGDTGRQYTIVAKDLPSPSVRSNAPPKVLSARDLEQQPKTDFKLYDAVLAAEPAPPSPIDSELENFLPMLQDYLKMNDDDINLPAASPTTARPSGSGQAITVPASLPPLDDPDYVWDVFYHRAGLINEFDNTIHIATLTGLPSSFGDPFASDSESEEEDEADEDSNDEGYYKNDYPDEESSEDSDGSDMFHEQSEDEGTHPWR